MRSTVETIQVILDRKLLQAADRAARRTKQNRSALVRDALRAHLQRLAVRELEERDRLGYSRHASLSDDAGLWEAEVQWPPE
jgi:metal-responsive CopG/Arc/MetJ family transcriptional regulator